MKHYAMCALAAAMALAVSGCNGWRSGNGLEKGRVEFAEEDSLATVSLETAKKTSPAWLKDSINALISLEMTDRYDADVEASARLAVKEFLAENDYYLSDHTIPDPSMNLTGTFGEAFGRYLNYEGTQDYYTGGVHGLAITVRFTIDTTTGRCMDYADYFTDGYEKALLPLVKQALVNDYFKGEADMIFDDDFSPFTLPAQSPTAEAEGLRFTYEPYEVAPYAAGCPDCVLTWETLRPLLRKEMLKTLP